MSETLGERLERAVREGPTDLYVSIPLTEFERLHAEVRRLTLADRQWADHVKRLSEENERLKAAKPGCLYHCECDRLTADNQRLLETWVTLSQANDHLREQLRVAEMVADSDEYDVLKRMQADNGRLRAALEGVIAEADRKTAAFDRAHQALAYGPAADRAQ